MMLLGGLQIVAICNLENQHYAFAEELQYMV